jgi:hypothetical protein
MGIGGEKVTVQKTGAKGEFKATYQIPEALKGAYMVAVRMESVKSEYYAFNYFFNATYIPTEEAAVESEAETAVTEAVAATETIETTVEEPTYQGYPSFAVTTVKKDTSVVIEATNLPQDEVFDVVLTDFVNASEETMTVGTLTADKDGKASGTFTMPAELKGVAQISIRLSGQKTGYFAYNYFFNQDFPMVEVVVEATEAPAAEATPAPAVEATAAPEAEATVAPTEAPAAAPEATATVQH